jgi:hypothetical protein
MDVEHDMVLKQENRMLLRRFGQWQPMEDMVMTLKDGTRVGLDGTVTYPDGTTRMLMDGEGITLDGEPTTLADAQSDRDDLSDETEV